MKLNAEIRFKEGEYWLFGNSSKGRHFGINLSAMNFGPIVKKGLLEWAQDQINKKS